MEKINEIDQELMKFDLEKDTFAGEAVSAEALKSSGCRINEATLEVENMQSVLESRDLISENNHQVLYPNKDTKPVESHVLLTQTNPNSDATLVFTIPAPTWKRIPQEKKVEIHERLAPSTLNRAGSDIDGHELPKKKKSVSYDDRKTTIILAEADVQPCQRR